MATSEKSGKPKKVGRPKGSTKSTKSKPKTVPKKSSSKKGGNFLGAVGELVAPTGWGSFATAAALVGIDQADAAFRRGKGKAEKSVKSGKKMRGGDLLPNSVFNRHRTPNKDFLDTFIAQMKERNEGYPNNYAIVLLNEYFSKLETSNQKVAAKRKLANAFLSGNKSSVIKPILESIIITP